MLLLLATALAAPPQVQEAWVELPTQTERDRAEALGAHYAEGIDGDYVRMHATPADWANIQAEFSTLALPMGLTAQSFAGYRSTEQIENELAAMADSSPLITLVHFGESVDGRPILGLEMGPKDAPSWRITGAHHGDEAISSELAMEVAQALLDNTGAWAGLIESLHITLIPVVNPDGLAQGSRYNANGVDLNRNYDFEWGDGTFRGPAPFSEPETRSVRTLSLYRSHHAGLSLHAGAFNLGWPWNYTTTLSPDEARLQALARRYEALCPDPDFYITNGAAWYVTSGDSNDW
ncbi:MAG: murein tripeptide amidase MpaA, partial [Cognaticolwellia sp.]